MMLHGAQSPSSVSPAAAAATPAAASHDTDALNQQTRMRRRKRKADIQDNERLSKRMSILNLERDCSKLYVPVETPSPSRTVTTAATSASTTPANNASSSSSHSNSVPDDVMQLDDSKHKVYIYNIDDELSSDSDSEDAKLIFLPDIEKHLRDNRIPPSVLANKDGELAGMQVVLYSDPKSLSVPEDKDSVRKAIIESRRRVRDQQRLQQEGKTPYTSSTSPTSPTAPTTIATIPASSADKTNKDVNVTSVGLDFDAMDVD
ncbi:hypothetical protein BGZ63DRAFT_398876 [Mariannaea sp. PMI_226]|nr:hypothetical protein BGZ63DRAFT_398876 [Mariannaea sp. PMI_226]